MRKKDNRRLRHRRYQQCRNPPEAAVRRDPGETTEKKKEENEQTTSRQQAHSLRNQARSSGNIDAEWWQSSESENYDQIRTRGFQRASANPFDSQRNPFQSGREPRTAPGRSPFDSLRNPSQSSMEREPRVPERHAYDPEWIRPYQPNQRQPRVPTLPDDRFIVVREVELLGVTSDGCLLVGTTSHIFRE
jgi:hypothetical protein